MTNPQELRRLLLRALRDAAPDGSAVNYRTLLPDHDRTEVLAAAKWLEANGYARWRLTGRLSLTEFGRRSVD